MISDFPRNQRLQVQIYNKKMLPTTKTCIQRSVRFAETSELTYTEGGTQEEKELRWYSKEEQAYFEDQFETDTCETGQKLATTPMLLIGQGDLYGCVGMESFLSRDVYMHTSEHRRIHVSTILAAQERQRMLDIRNEEQLSLLSERSSEWTVSRTRNHAAMYWDILKT